MQRFLIICTLLVFGYFSTVAHTRDSKVKIKQWTQQDMDVSPHIPYADFWEAMKNLDLDYPERKGAGKDFVDFARALKHITLGQIEQAENLFRQIILKTDEKSIAEKSMEFFTLLVGYRVNYSPTILYMEDSTDTKHRKITDLSVLPKDGAPVETYIFPAQPVKVPIILAGSGFGVPMVEVELNDKREILWLDTGATTTLISSDIAQECDIQRMSEKHLKSHTATSREIDTQLACIKNLQIGGLRIDNHPARITSERNLRHYFNYKMDGILGWNAMRNVYLEIDSRKKQLILRKPDEARTEEKNLFWLGFPVIKVASKNGVTLHFGIDTGAFETTITDNIFKKIKFKKVYNKSRIIWGAGGEEKIKSRVVPKLELALNGYLLKFKDVFTLPKHHAEFIELDGVLGNDILDAGKIMIDCKNGIFEIQKF